MSREPRPILTNMLLGAVAGATASYVMAQVTHHLDEHQTRRAKEQEAEANRGKRASDGDVENTPGMVEQRGAWGLSSGGSIAVEKVARMAGKELTSEERMGFEIALNVGLSMGVGAVYALLRHRIPGANLGHGLIFGTTFWLLVDEVGNTVLGLTPPATEFPWQTHMRGLAGHMVFGMVAETVLALADE